MKRAVITGMGVVSCIGNNISEVTESLRLGKSGITKSRDFYERGFRSQVWGQPNIKLNEIIDRRWLRFMGDGAAFSYVAMQEAINDAGLGSAEISNDRIGLIIGSGGPSTKNQVAAADIARERGPKKVGPFMVPRTMSSTISATLSTAFKIKGISYSISSACATSSHCIGNALELIQLGKQDVIFAGGGEELDWTLSVLFDAMPAMSSKYNDAPQVASRAFDANRDGFVIAGGGGVVVVEELEHAKARGANIYAEISGYGATSDGYDMVQPSGEGGVRRMKMAMQNLQNGVDYINTHGTSTPVGDVQELIAIREVFKDLHYLPALNSTKSLTGHSLGAAGVQEAIYSLIMMRENFIAASANIETLDEEAQDMPIVLKRKDNVRLNCILSNSFGFGGTNATLAFSRYEA